MILRHIYVNLNLLEYPDNLNGPFGFRTRYLCNFLERKLRPLRFETRDFSKICVQGRHDPSISCALEPVNSLIVSVGFDEVRYQCLDEAARHEFFIGMLGEGLEKAAREHSIPLQELRAAIDEFRRGSYRNEWEHQSKIFREIGLRAILRCSLDQNRFELSLDLRREKVNVFSEVVLATKPDEIIFSNSLNEVALFDRRVVVLDKFEREIFSVDVSKFDSKLIR